MVRSLRVVLAFFLAASVTACASTLRLPGQRDPMVEVVRILADALKAQQPKPLPTPPPAATPTPTPEGGR